MLAVRSLSYFLATLETGSFTATARVFGVSVPTVSASMAQLEDAMGHALFLRTPRRLLPSQAAAGVETAVRAILDGLLAMEGREVPPGADTLALLRICQDLDLSLLIIARFVAVFEAGSIGAAASALRVTQPQISRQIAALEAIVGQRLFDRHRHGMAANAAAAALYARARPLCDIAAGLIGHGNRLFVESLHTTRIGSVPPFHPESRLAGVLAELCTRWPATAPETHLSLETDVTDALIGALLAGELHAVIVETDLIPEECASRVLLQSALELVVGRFDGDRGPEQILMTSPLVVQRRSSGLRRMIDAWLLQHRIDPPHILEVDAMPVIGRLVADHGYCSLIPAGAYPVHSPSIRRIDLPGAPVFSQRLVWRRAQAATRLVRRVLQIVDRIAAE
ncbi:MAG: LysR family transcriptional regulator [Rhodobacteraceae bacterium]|jgi:LysR family nitrogen assimilation transcriptional regulator|nr:LysR family transcriptional regulator [Paracoccaceae bacterium]